MFTEAMSAYLNWITQAGVALDLHFVSLHSPKHIARPEDFR
jgi:hypothetical protein